MIEAARYQYLVSRQAFLDLRDKRYRMNPVNPNRLQYSEVDEINHVLGRFSFGASHDAMAERLNENWADANRPAAEKSQIAEIARTLGAPKLWQQQFGDSQFLRKFLAEKISTMSKAEFDRDLETLINRYREIEAACVLPFPESNRKLGQLSKAWTLDKTWKRSFPFLWSLPKPIPQRAIRQMYANAYLAAAVIKKWRSENNGKTPPNIEVTLKAAGIDLIPVDPCSGKPLRLKTNPKQASLDVVVYSVGEAGKDQSGKPFADRRYQRWVEIGSSHLMSGNHDVPDGDWVF